MNLINKADGTELPNLIFIKMLDAKTFSFINDNFSRFHEVKNLPRYLKLEGGKCYVVEIRNIPTKTGSGYTWQWIDAVEVSEEDCSRIAAEYVLDVKRAQTERERRSLDGLPRVSPLLGF